MAEENKSSEYVQVEYLGGGERTVSARDFKNLGVEGQGKVVWDDSNDFVAGLSEEAAARLVETHRTEFRIVQSS